VLLRFVTLCALLLAAPAATAQIFLDDDAPADPGPGDPTLSDPLEDGSLEHPFDTLAEAIAAYQHVDQILCQPGRYTGPGNGGIVVGKPLAIKSLRGADETLFDLEHAAPFLTLTAQAHVVSVEGMTIAHGAGGGTGGIETLSPQTELVLSACVLRGNKATGTSVAGGALLLRGALECSSTAFLSNTSAGSGGAVAIASDSTNVAYQNFVMCTFRANSAAAEGGAVWAEGTASVPIFVRTATACVFRENQALGGLHDQIGEAVLGNFFVVDCVVQDGWTGLGSGNLDIDPLFVFHGSFHLSVATPVLGLTGSLTCTLGPVDADGQPRDCHATELGADAVLPVTLASGSAGAGARLWLAVAGASPGLPVLMLVGSALADSPTATPAGLLKIDPDGLRVLAMPPRGGGRYGPAGARRERRGARDAAGAPGRRRRRAAPGDVDHAALTSRSGRRSRVAHVAQGPLHLGSGPSARKPPPMVSRAQEGLLGSAPSRRETNALADQWPTGPRQDARAPRPWQIPPHGGTDDVPKPGPGPHDPRSRGVLQRVPGQKAAATRRHLGRARRLREHQRRAAPVARSGLRRRDRTRRAAVQALVGAAHRAAAGGAERPADHHRRRRLRRAQHLRRRDPDAGHGPRRERRPALQPHLLHGAVLAHARGADHRAQPPLGRLRRDLRAVHRFPRIQQRPRFGQGHGRPHPA
jgi:hypothetical protein